MWCYALKGVESQRVELRPFEDSDRLPTGSEWRVNRTLPMSIAGLGEKLWKIEAFFAGAGMAGERLAGEAALERVREHLTELGRQIRFLRCNSQWRIDGRTIRFRPCR